MSARQMKDYHCRVIDEMVKIRLCNKPTAGMRSRHTLFVQCDQSECQHVGANEPPCPLNLSLPMLADEIRAREEKAQLRREGLEDR